MLTSLTINQRSVEMFPYSRWHKNGKMFIGSLLCSLLSHAWAVTYKLLCILYLISCYINIIFPLLTRLRKSRENGNDIFLIFFSEDWTWP